ncbi:MAG TPA: DUF559 domain-containing protein [Steroidobacteraceae bacterium]
MSRLPCGMLTGLFRDRTRQRTGHRAADVLGQLLQSKSLKPHRFIRNGEIGPFLVGHVCRERALVVELASRGSAPGIPEQNRRALLLEPGYSLLVVDRRELSTQPERVLARIRAALR